MSGDISFALHIAHSDKKTVRIITKAEPLLNPETLLGSGSRDKAGRLCRKNEFERVLPVTDKTIFSFGLHEKS